MQSTLRYHLRNGQKYIDRIVLYISLLCSSVVLFHLGYNTDPVLGMLIDRLVAIAFFSLFIINSLRTALSVWVNRRVQLAHYSGLVLFGYLILIAVAWLTGGGNPAGGDGSETGLLGFFRDSEWLYLGIFTITVAEISRSSLFLDKLYFNPTLLFIVAFLGLTLAGALLLMLPNSVQSPTPLRFIDALFMSTSAVCITGLTVVDVARTFTPFGQTVLLVLIQLGGLGIMTFTGFFGYFFSGGFSYKNQLLFGEIIGQQKVGSVIRTLMKIILVTLSIEAVGVVLLFFAVPAHAFSSYSQHLFFAVFHAVSAFCNAGFTAVENGFDDPIYKFNYEMQLILVGLFVAGGIGFTIVFNGFTFMKQWWINLFHWLRSGRAFIHRPWVFSFNSRLMAWASLILIVFSSMAMFLLESGHALAEHKHPLGKIVAAIFMGNSTRTSGFSIVDPAQFSTPTIPLIMMLMWIGASPGSTGGGIKNTTFAIALLNIVTLARGRDHLEIFRRRVSRDSVNKAFGIIALSLIAIGLSIFLLSFTDGEKGLRALTFETVSAYATCGLSLGITPHLSDAGKMIISVTMFTGRVGLLTLLVAFIKSIRNKNYTYPEEKILY